MKVNISYSLDPLLVAWSKIAAYSRKQQGRGASDNTRRSENHTATAPLPDRTQKVTGSHTRKQNGTTRVRKYCNMNTCKRMNGKEHVYVS